MKGPEEGATQRLGRIRLAPSTPRVRVQVDASLSRLAYRCYPNGCPPERNCCIGAAVTVSRAEARRIDGLLDEVTRWLPHLREGEGYADVFVEDGSEMQIEPRDERGTCPFLFQRQSRALCALHHLALQSGRPVSSMKPRSCRHWPLVLELSRQRVRITVHPEARALGCVGLSKDLPGQPSMRVAFAEEIAEICRLVGAQHETMRK